MKILKSFILQSFKPLAVATIALLSFTYNIHAQEGDAVAGETLFKANCGACHFPGKDMTGPALKGSRQNWIDNSSEDNFYAWVKNSQKVISNGDSYAKGLYAEWGTVMTPQAVNNSQIDDIFAYVEGFVEPIAIEGKDVAVAGEEESSGMIWWIIAILLIIVVGAVATVRGNLSKISKKEDGEEVDENQGVVEGAKKWAWNHRGPVGIFALVATLCLLTGGMVKLLDIGVFEDYKPEQPIQYSHELHAGDLAIDCKYCHNAVTKSRHATIPTVNVCMNCHKTVTEGTTTGTEEISKIHSAAGYDPDTRSFSGVTKPIKWVKVHNLPDHVYFNHSQHVVVGGVDCAQCHGDMKKETVARVMTTEDLNAVEENKIKFTRPTLTMGWCIECHRQASVDIAGSHIDGALESEDSYYGVIHQRLLKDKNTYQKYLKDDVISVAELGGIECAKCHY